MERLRPRIVSSGHEFAALAPLILIFFLSVFRLAQLTRRSETMYLGWGLGLLIYGPQLVFFWTIFGAGAIALWLVLASWLGLYFMLQRFALLKWGMLRGAPSRGSAREGKRRPAAALPRRRARRSDNG